MKIKEIETKRETLIGDLYTEEETLLVEMTQEEYQKCCYYLLKEEYRVPKKMLKGMM